MNQCFPKQQMKAWDCLSVRSLLGSKLGVIFCHFLLHFVSYMLVTSNGMDSDSRTGLGFLFFPPLEWLSGRIPLGKLGWGRSTTGCSVLGSRRTREWSSGLEGSSDWLKEMPCCLCRSGKQCWGGGGGGTWVHLHSRQRRDHFIARWDPFDASLHVMGKRLLERSLRAPEQRRICTSSDGRLSWEIIAPRQFCEFPPTQTWPLLQRYSLFYLKIRQFSLRLLSIWLVKG